MRVKSKLFHQLQLDARHCLLTGRAVRVVKELFDTLDIHRVGGLDDVIFVAWLTHCTDLTEREALAVLDMLDVDDSGSIEFDEFYLLTCMLIAVAHGKEKKFLWRHSRTCFELMDQDSSGAISIEEFETIGRLFSISQRAAKKIFDEFDCDQSRELDLAEFRLFSLAAIDQQRKLDESLKQKEKDKARTVCTVS